MIILPDRNVPRAKILMPVFDKEWRTPSLAQPKDMFGNENTTKFRINAKSNDGVVIWTGWFDDRADFDAFIWAIALGTLKQDRALWDLPTPNWQPYLGELISYEFATTTYLTTAGSLQTYNVPSDWNNNNNDVQTVGGGGTGARGVAISSHRATGGGGGAWNKSNNISLTKGGTASYQIGATVSMTATGGGSNGLAGNDTWFNGSSIGVSSVGSKAGQGGAFAGSGTVNGGAGGVGSSGVGGGGANDGGNGGSSSSSICGTGGGGAGGPNGAGNNGNNTSGGLQGTSGGSGNAGFGGAGGAGGDTPGDGGNGSEFGSGYGTGGGGGGRGSSNNPPPTVGGSGGNYGGGGGGYTGQGSLGGVSASGGPGKQGLIVITYEPLKISGFNMPMLGM